ncbi:serine/threonine-protein kinase [Streptomyces sp. TLI_105]|uniref:serine/threonine-protein kinase n=1 Tax=Streptomyces sp. TLI_105 TaxID=1881019 RepID=UPI00089559AB|nr:serine/threonine-protein kinase [Streptomyces sp. TLI_105]SED87877.1 Serine/threonine protein kinase [Streptomyces sp. TLI_105]
MSSGEYERLAGRYRAVRQLGRGGMGVVWRAVDEVLGREVAVKELRTYNDASGPELEDLRLRMQREARAAARVRHPGVIAVHDVTEHEGRPVIVMELIDGPSLDGVLGERGTLDPREAAQIGAAVLEALAAAHDVGVLHRDVKPGNVLLDRGGRVVLTDFGIATMDDPGDGSATHLTRSGEIVGSLDYLAPERAQGQQPGPASDVWALGATLYAAVEGTSPFRRTSTWQTLNAIVVEPLPAPRLAGPLAPVLARLLDKDPTRRPDARTAARLLTEVAEGRDATASGAEGAQGMAPGGPAGAPGAAGPWPTAVDAPAAGPAASSATQGTPTAGPGASPSAPDAWPGGPDTPALGASHLWAPTQHDAVPHRLEGFGPVVPPAMGVPGQAGPGGPVPVSGAPDGPVVYGAGAAPTRRSATRGRAGRNRSGALVAAAVAGVLLVGGGVTYALVGRDGGPEQGQLADGQSPTSPGAEPGRVLDSGAPGAGATATESPSASATPSEGDAEKPSSAGPTRSASPSSPSSSSSSSSSHSSPSPSRTTKAPVPGGSTGGTAGGGSSTTGGGGTSPSPASGGCAPSGGGKYDCQVWRTEKTYRHDGGEMGVLNAGTNYFYCQVDLGRRETYGQWTNIWWARTDDDSGNTNVYFSVVYLKGGDNDQPVPGLPIC